MIEFMNSIDPRIIVGIKIAILSIIADTLLGVCIAIKDGEFNLSIFPKFIATGILPYIGGLLVTALMATLDPDFMYLFNIAVVGITGKFGLKEALYEKAKALFK